MAVTRRQFLIGAGLAAAAASGGLAACAPGAGGGGSQGGAQGNTLALAWWGNPTRNKNTDAHDRCVHGGAPRREDQRPAG